MNQGEILYLSRQDVEAVGLDMPAIINRLEQAYLEKSRGQVEAPPKFGIHPTPAAFIHAMPAYIPTLASAGLKWVSAYPENPGRGLPNISGLIVLNDPANGLPLAVMDCTWITAQRTGAKSAIAAKRLARPDSRTAGILACGQQGRTNLAALACLFPIERVYLYDSNPAAVARYIAEMGSRYGYEFIAVSSPRDAVVECDLVVTSGPIVKSPQPVIDAGWLKPGGFASAMDYASYWTPAAIAEMDVFCTDDLPQFLSHRQSGYFEGLPDPAFDLGDLVSGAVPPPAHPGRRALAMCLGLAMDDVAIAPEVYRRAVDLGVGVWLER